jgi:peptidoglycan/xylan/chitin deacetylase (PgdA/CDA1 family)
MLSERGLNATYYASAGLMSGKTVVGELFNRSDLTSLVGAGHELACHTVDHARCCDVHGAELVLKCEENRRQVSEMLDGYKLRNFSFPEGVVNPASKALLSSIYDTCRTIEPGINSDPIDLGFLRANSVYACVPISKVAEVIRENARRRGWLILYTHDVRNAPSGYGCTPEYFRDALNCALDSGADVLTVADARKRFVDLCESNAISGASKDV